MTKVKGEYSSWMQLSSRRPLRAFEDIEPSFNFGKYVHFPRKYASQILRQRKRFLNEDQSGLSPIKE